MGGSVECVVGAGVGGGGYFLWNKRTKTRFSCNIHLASTTKRK